MSHSGDKAPEHKPAVKDTGLSFSQKLSAAVDKFQHDLSATTDKAAAEGRADVKSHPHGYLDRVKDLAHSAKETIQPYADAAYTAAKPRLDKAAAAAQPYLDKAIGHSSETSAAVHAPAHKEGGVASHSTLATPPIAPPVAPPVAAPAAPLPESGGHHVNTAAHPSQPHEPEAPKVAETKVAETT